MVDLLATPMIHATPATSTREPTHPRVSASSKNIKIVSYHRVRGCRAYGLLPLWLLAESNMFSFVADIDECQTNGSNDCGALERCVNTPGGYRCENQTEAACKLGEEKLDGSCIGKQR